MISEKITTTVPKTASFKDGYWKEVPVGSTLIITKKYLFGSDALCFGSLHDEYFWIFLAASEFTQT